MERTSGSGLHRAQSLHTVTYSYLPLHTDGQRTPPCSVVTYRYLPLPTVTYRRAADSPPVLCRVRGVRVRGVLR